MVCVLLWCAVDAGEKDCADFGQVGVYVTQIVLYKLSSVSVE